MHTQQGAACFPTTCLHKGIVSPVAGFRNVCPRLGSEADSRPNALADVASLCMWFSDLSVRYCISSLSTPARDKFFRWFTQLQILKKPQKVVYILRHFHPIMLQNLFHWAAKQRSFTIWLFTCGKKAFVRASHHCSRHWILNSLCFYNTGNVHIIANGARTESKFSKLFHSKLLSVKLLVSLAQNICKNN